MKLAELYEKSILLLGFGTEGQATYDFLRTKWPSKPFWIADQRYLNEFPEKVARRIEQDSATQVHFGPNYLSLLAASKYDVIIKTPGIPATIEPIDRSTTASLIYDMLRQGQQPAELVGNIGQPPLARLATAAPRSYFVHEFSSHQLAEVQSSPHIAVLLNISEHLDYYASFEEYVSAKENITRFQQPDDFLIFNPDYPVPKAIAQRTKAALKPFSAKDAAVWNFGAIPLAGKFNLENVMAAVTAASLCGVDPEAIRAAIKEFRALPHRLEPVGTFNSVTFYDDSIATVPDATLAALERPVRGTFKDYRERGDSFKAFVKQLANSRGTR